MTSTTIRIGGLALAGAMACSALVNTTAASAADSATSLQTDRLVINDNELPSAIKKVVAAGNPSDVQRAALAISPRLSMLSLPTVAAAASSRGYAQQDLVVDLAPDLIDRDLDFIVQRQDGAAWVDVTTGTTTGAMDKATVPGLPAGVYRVFVPEQIGLAEFASQPINHQPRQLSAALSFDRSSTSTTVNVDPDPTVGGTYDFTLEVKEGNEWRFVSARTTTEAGGVFTFNDLPSGTYRVVAPDQANALGTTSNEVSVVSSADLRAAAERAAAARAASSQSSAASTPNSRSAGAAAVAPSYNDAPMAGGGSVVSSALAQVGARYRLGATGNGAFDCSGLTSYAYRQAGKSIPRTARSQYGAVTKVSNPQPGDLVFFLNGAEHVGIYIGGGKMVHAANPGRGVEVSSFNSGWYSRTFTGFGRVG